MSPKRGPYIVQAHPQLPGQQRGAVLIVSMIILLILAFLAVQSTQTSTLEEKMAGNFRNKKVAFEGAEAALLAAEAWIDAQTDAPLATGNGQNGVFTLGAVAIDKHATWDPTSAGVHELVNANLYALNTPPMWVIEERQRANGAGGNAEIGAISQSSTNNDLYSYRITAIGSGTTANSAVVLQSHYERSF